MKEKKNSKISRMWINQPSAIQAYHKYHGTNVLAAHEVTGGTRVYFLSGDVVSIMVPSSVLSKGWVNQ